MGVLEDAIREHIELRRRHGAGEDELRDQEAEALGPARREVDDEVGSAEEVAAAELPVEPVEEPVQLTEVPVLEEPDPVEMPVLEEPEPEVPFDDAGEREDEAVPAASLDLDEPVWSAPPEEPMTEVRSTFEEPFGEEPPAEELPPEELPAEELLAEESPPEELPPEELPPEELPPEGDPPPADAPPPAAEADDDVLEETPDFLAETPEHDRLWFEQKPPRDFDFD